MCLVTYSWTEDQSRRKFDSFHQDHGIAWAHLQLTSFCNFSCHWCYSHETSFGRNISMGRRELRSIIDKLMDCGVAQVTFGGGEPLLYEDLLHWVYFLSSRGIIVHINTNSYFLDEETVKKLADSGLNQIQSNIESDIPGVHDSVRGKKGAFQRVLSAAELSRRYGINFVSQTVVTRDNMDRLLDIVKFARRNGIESCRFWDMTLSGRAISTPERLPRRYLETLESLSSELRHLGVKRITSYDPLYPSRHDTSPKIEHYPCPSRLGMLMHVSVEGDVLYCCVDERSRLFNIHSVEDGSRLPSMYREKIAEFLGTHAPLPPGCAGCEQGAACRGGCMGRRGIDSDVDYLCRRSDEKRGLPLSGRNIKEKVV